ncbi:sigma-70 family RNA polymerase sigma factor [Pedobacter sp. P351]|uniref:RNA polymerase sigma factor n=1 Tax=Pedobacter superstes TaxID=3133441 RepID=UPI003096203E
MTEKDLIRLTDKELLQLIKKNDSLALNALFKKYYSSLCKFVSIYIKDEALTEELIADLFIKIWDNRENYNISDIKNYLFVSARNMAINCLKKKILPISYVESIEDYHEVLYHEESPFQIMKNRESYDAILKIIDTLPARQREIFLMSLIDGFEKSKIALILGISIRTVETTLYTALKELRYLISNSGKSLT